MSHFVAALHLEGAPLARDVLEVLARGLPALGGAARTVHRGPFGLVEHRLPEPAAAGTAAPEPAIVVAGTIRLDALGPAPRSAHEDALRARWRRGGEAALCGLRGDLGFVLWDPAHRALVALRDLFGVAPLYHARVGPLLLLASDPAPLLRHPEVDRRPDEAALGDFLLVGENTWPGRTYHRGIRRVRAGHRLRAEDGRVDETRHDALAAAAWDAPAPDPRTLAGTLRERLGEAVARRLPADGATVLLSGGLDSAAVAEAAATCLGEAAGARLLACTFGSEPVLAEEVAHAGAVARHLGLAHHVEPLEARPLFDASRLDGTVRDPTGPGLDPRDPGTLWHRAAAHAPVVLTGFGGDPALRPSPGALPRLAMRGRPFAALRALAAQLRAQRRLPRLGVRAALAARRRDPFEGWPGWIAPEFAERLALRARWRELQAPLRGDLRHRRPEAVASLASPFWPDLFECLAPSPACPAVQRHPWLDAELLEWLLAVPPVPWCEDKHLLREALRGRLPEATRRRPKATLASYPPQPIPVHQVDRIERELRGVAELEGYVDVPGLLAALRRAAGTGAPGDWAALLPALAAGLWLRDLQLEGRPADRGGMGEPRRVA